MPTIDLGKVVGPQGPQGPKGDAGPQGVQGPQGSQGATGITPNIQVGTVTTLEPGSNATVTRQTSSPDAAPVFDFGLPRGADSVNDGDMKKSVYDTGNKAQDVYEYADTKMPISGGEFTGYVKGKSHVMGREGGFRNIYFGTELPSSSLGARGDIYIRRSTG